MTTLHMLKLLIIEGISKVVSRYFIALLMTCSFLCFMCCGGGSSSGQKILSVTSTSCTTSCTKSGTTYTCPDASYKCIKDAVTAASPGDTINVTATGTVTWASTLIITRGVKLIGPGYSKLTVINGVSPSFGALIQYQPSNYTANANVPFRISGFTFNMDAVGMAISLGICGMSQPFAHQMNTRIDNNRFTNGLNDSRHPPIYDCGGIYGVIDSNTFDNIDAVIAHIPGCDKTWWDYDSLTTGASDYLYLEDNTISIIDGSNGAMMCQSEQGGRYVHRYNSITVTSTNWYPLWDIHGNQGGGTSGIYGPFGYEIYGNKVIDVNNSGGALADCRGGQCLNFDNNVTTSSSSIAITLFESDCTCANPTTNPDIPYVQNVHNSYFWGNRYSASGYAGTLSPTTVQVGGTINCLTAPCAGGTCCPDEFDGMPQVNREFFADTGATPYVSCGTLASLPSTCSVGQGYWATNQSCSSLANMVGASPSTPINGTLYKCTALNTWTPYYTPYTYPHPLRSIIQ